VFSVLLIEHGTKGIQKILFFAALFAAAGLSGVFLPRNRWKKVDWLRTVSQQSAAQYILFFAVPLLWKARSWAWFCLTSLLAASTLWDPYFNTLWKKNGYRILLVTFSLVFVSGLSLVIWAPEFLQHNTFFALAICLLGVLLSLTLRVESSNTDTPNPAHRTGFPPQLIFQQTAPALFLLSFMFLTKTPLPPLGVWIAEGHLIAHPEKKSLECITRISAPSGFVSTVTHLWTLKDNDLMQDSVALPAVTGNGIDDKPFTTRSEKMVFPVSWETLMNQVVRCEVRLPGGLVIGRIESLPTATNIE
jgi:hypothetical protein